MTDVWLRCDHCNHAFRVESDHQMQLAVRFKPSLFPRALAPLHQLERRLRCRGCGWVNIFVPAPGAVSADPNRLLTPSWRDISLKS
jgi:hypothetical protein